METWKTMELYPKYQVSTEGKIRNAETHRIYAQWLGKDGYLRMEMWLDGKRKGMLVHRMVALCYLENPLNLPEVNHKNKIKSDNRVENLEWVTRQENMDHRNADPKIQEQMHQLGLRAKEWNLKHTAKPVASYDLDGNLLKVYPSLISAERDAGINRKYIRACLKGERLSAGGRIWRKIEGSTTISEESGVEADAARSEDLPQ